MIDFLDRAGESRRDGRHRRAQDGHDVAIGFDLGGTNLRASLFRGLDAVRKGDRDALKTVAHKVEPIGSARSPAEISKRINSVIGELEDKSQPELNGRPVERIGIGFAGMLGPNRRTVTNSPHYGWRDVDFGTAIDTALGPSRRTKIFNDVNAITYGEYVVSLPSAESREEIDNDRGQRNRCGDDLLAVFVGTGIGAGLVRGGQLVSGAGGCATELGHFKFVLDDSALPCACGMRGCIEAYTGGRYLQRRVRAELRGGARSLAPSIAGGIEKVQPSHLDLAAARGDDYSLDLFAELAPLLGAAVANAVTLLNPSCLLLGGGMLSRMPVFSDHVLTALEVAVNPPAHRGLTIASATLGDVAGPLGAALLVSNPKSR